MSFPRRRANRKLIFHLKNKSSIRVKLEDIIFPDINKGNIEEFKKYEHLISREMEKNSRLIRQFNYISLSLLLVIYAAFRNDLRESVILGVKIANIASLAEVLFAIAVTFVCACWHTIAHQVVLRRLFLSLFEKVGPEHGRAAKIIFDHPLGHMTNLALNNLRSKDRFVPFGLFPIFLISSSLWMLLAVALFLGELYLLVYCGLSIIDAESWDFWTALLIIGGIFLVLLTVISSALIFALKFRFLSVKKMEKIVDNILSDESYARSFMKEIK